MDVDWHETSFTGLPFRFTGLQFFKKWVLVGSHEFQWVFSGAERVSRVLHWSP